MILIVTIGIILPPAAAEGLIVIDNVSPFNSPYGSITVNATAIDDLVTLPLYHGTFSQNGSINIQLKQIGKERQNVTPASEAPAAAQKALEQYGGLPPDAVLDGASTTYSEIYNHTLHATTYKEPMFTTISYSREVNGLWVFGDGNSIILTLGENGELLRIFKVWRDYTCTGDADIIPIYSAFEKLRRGEVLDEPMVSDEKIIIDIASPAYYAKNIETNETILEPIWLLVGKTESGTRLGFHIYARHFANFTPSSTNITTFQTIQFTDTSETAPVKWHWDFGDGTNSTKQNPSHMYRTAGNYSVTLKAWNDMGSDTETKEITVTFTKPLNADFNATPLVASTGDTLRFYDNSDTSPNKWYWEFGDGKTSTLRNPAHTYTTGGNYTVNLTAWNANGSDKRTIEDYITIHRYPKPVAGFTSNYSWDMLFKYPLAIQFTDTSKGNITGWYWEFGDGSNSTERNPVHTFDIMQHEISWSYHTQLTVTDDVGRVSKWGDSIYGQLDYHPDFIAEPEAPESLNITFRDISPPLDEITYYAWDFGDGTSVWWYPTQGENPSE
jgi:PKD repeat protein